MLQRVSKVEVQAAARVARCKLFRGTPLPQLSDLISKTAESFWNACSDRVQIPVVCLLYFSSMTKLF